MRINLTARRGLLPRLILAAAAIGLFLTAYQWGSQYRFAAHGPAEIAGVRIVPPRPVPDEAQGLATASDAAGDTLPLIGAWTLLAIAEAEPAPPHAALNRLIEIYNRLADRPVLRAAMQIILMTDREPSNGGLEQPSPALHQIAVGAERIALWRATLGLGNADNDGAVDAVAAPQALFLLDPEARLIAFFPSQQAPSAIAADLTTLIGNAR